MHIWVPKKKRGLHFEARARYRDTDGRMIKDTGWRHNILHDLGEDLILNMLFEPFFTTYTWKIRAVDCSYVYAAGPPVTHTITDRDTGGAFGVVMANDYLFLCGGYTAGGTSVTSGYYRVESKTTADIILLTATPSSVANTNITGGIVVIRPMNFGIALDARTTLAETDTTATMEAYEEDGTGYWRQNVDPIDTTNTFWTVAQDSDTGDYQATSDQVTFNATGTNWQANRNVSLVAGLCDTDATDTYLHSAAADWTNDVLVSSVAFDDPITVGNGQSLGVQFRLRLRESA